MSGAPPTQTAQGTKGPRTWQGVRAEVLRRIRARDWPPGTMIPNEADLARELGCARATVNRALRDLAEAGVLDRRRRAGTRVAATPVRRAVLQIPVIRDEIAAQGRDHGYRLLSRALAAPPAATAAALALPEGAQALHVRALHFADAQPFVLEDRWIAPEAAPGVLDADLARISANEWLVRHAPFASGTLSFGAVTADAGLAGLLDCAPGTALLRLDRTTSDGARMVTAAALTYHAGYRLRTTI
ncbi:GntR family transcriptional regulator [Sediminimonas sp.]|uniref:GntR family transcriptional regulator n=1 Tax=Sediminimonas sp. TaxID=2823379 RepID=UPI0025D82128|nr:GntR family transcriptional regulator [Sediminimonas sp.]